MWVDILYFIKVYFVYFVFYKKTKKLGLDSKTISTTTGMSMQPVQLRCVQFIAGQPLFYKSLCVSTDVLVWLLLQLKISQPLLDGNAWKLLQAFTYKSLTICALDLSQHLYPSKAKP